MLSISSSEKSTKDFIVMKYSINRSLVQKLAVVICFADYCAKKLMSRPSFLM